MAESIRVLLVDDHAVVREGLRAFLQLQDGLEIVGEAADGDEAVREAAAPVAGRDPDGPGDAAGSTGSARCASCACARPDSKVIVLTSFLEDDRLLPAIQAGAAGYLLKNVEPAALARGDPRRPRRRPGDHRSDGRRPPGARDRRRIAAAHPGARAPDPARTRCARVDRARALQQADRARAGDLGEDRQDARRPRAGQARRQPTGRRRR